MPPRRRNNSNRRRVSVPQLNLDSRSRTTTYEDQVLGQARRAAPQRGAPRAIDWSNGATAQAEARHSMSPAMELAIDMAREGDDSLLLPYQPTPSINPPRPRTRAIGYDAASQTMYVRFRESRKYPQGAVYAYYNVPPKEWKNIRRVKSPGRFITRRLESFPYARTDI